MQFFKAVQQGKKPKNTKEQNFTRYAYLDTVETEDGEVNVYKSMNGVILNERFYTFTPATKEEVAEFYDNEDVDNLLAAAE